MPGGWLLFLINLRPHTTGAGRNDIRGPPPRLPVSAAFSQRPTRNKAPGMTAAEQAAGQNSSAASPRPETSPPSPITQQQPGWSYHPAMPRLSEVVSGWHDSQENHNPLRCAEDGGVGGGEGGSEESGTIPPHRRKIVRTRAAPAGPHPYLDRFASGMHRPLEGQQ